MKSNHPDRETGAAALSGIFGSVFRGLAGGLLATALLWGCSGASEQATDDDATGMAGAGGSGGNDIGSGGDDSGSVDDQGRVVDWKGTLLCDPASQDCSPFTTVAAGYDLATPSFGRLNNPQYNNTVRDLLGTALTPADKFPPDESALGFDTIGATLRVQPEHVEKYLPASSALISELYARASDDPLRVRYLSCDPSAGADCQLQILLNFASKAWRRPALDTELAQYVTWIGERVGAGYTLDEAMQGALRAVLLSPSFMYRVELDPNPADPAPHALGAYEIASRLSYFLWSTMPDDALLEAAANGSLLTSAGLNSEALRLLATPERAHALVDQFAIQWLNVNKVRGVRPDATTYPGFDEPLRQAMVAETEMVLSDFFTGTQPINELLTAPFTYVNARLAQHYGFPGAAGLGADFVRVDTTGTTRLGILTHGSFLTGMSNPTRTSPVKRGRHVLERLLCSSPPDPPPGTNTNIDQGSGLENLSVRERLREHQKKGSTCASCHVVMDAIGLGLENYDGIGSYRASDQYGQIDPAGEIPASDGSGAKLPFSGVNELGGLLAADTRLMPCVVEKLLTYSMGRSFGAPDTALKKALGMTSTAYGGHLRAAVEAVVMSEVFRNRRAAMEGAGG